MSTYNMDIPVPEENGYYKLIITGTPPNLQAELVFVETGIVPSGTFIITENGNYDVTNYATAEVNVASSGGYGGVSVIPIQSIAEAMQTNTLGGLSQSTEPTTTGENPQTYQDEQGVWHNKYWLDTSVSPNVWKEYNPNNQSWEIV